MKNQQARLLLAVILAAPAFALADNIPGHSNGANKYVTFSEGFISQQDLRGNSAQCNFLGSTSGVVSPASSIAGDSSSGIAKGEKDSLLGMSLSAGMASGRHFLKLVDFGANQASSSDKNRGKGKGKQDSGSGGGNGTGVGSGVSSPVISVVEPKSQTLLLFGLAGLGMLFYLRKTFTNAI